MSANLSGRRLLVISDTPVYKEAEGYVAFEPVVRELEALAPLFDEIVWLACKVEEKKYAMRQPDHALSIRIVGMPGVLKRYNLFRMLALYPVFAYYMLSFSAKATHTHTRGPSHPAFLGILLAIVHKRFYWHKYAGNWRGQKLALSYRIQRYLLKFNRNQRVKVTVNGSWPDTPPHILSFENPCLSEAELKHAALKASEKKFTDPLNIIFAGNLTKAKGILELIDAMQDSRISTRFENLYIAGDGELHHVIARKINVDNNLVKIHLLGSQSRKQMDKVYETCHVVVLPSTSEGFPKVIAEAAAYGCIPVVTDVSSISQYVRDGESGYLLKDNSVENIIAVLNHLATNTSLVKISSEAQKMAGVFTYERFINRAKTEIFQIESSA
ncbi:MAG: glycosyltransferase [Flavipsychrobacter sp.]|jgi:glycosyltransferase involved in cell wall biosynthesis|nr:glycosyltransferase [Flavipsychrobacter sp.]